MKKRDTNHYSQGFTLIELMLATVIFSIVMVVLLASFLEIGQLYYKGISLTSTTEDTRTLVDDISNDVRSAQSTTTVTPYDGGMASYFCIGLHRYAYALDKQITPDEVDVPNAQANPVGVIVSDIDTLSACPSPETEPDVTGSRQLLGANMQLNNLQFNGGTPNQCSSTVCDLEVHVVYYGVDNTVFDSNMIGWRNTTLDPGRASGAPDAFCSGNLLSTQFCAAVDLSTITLIGGI